MKIKIEQPSATVAELNKFNPIGEDNWENEFSNIIFPNSFLVTARSDSGALVGTQGFMEYKVNHFGEMKLGFRSERTLLSSECRGKGVFKKQIELGKSEMVKRGGALCFGSTTAMKAFQAAGFQGFNGYRIYNFKSFSFVKALHLTTGIIINYLSSQLIRIAQRKNNISDLYNILIVKSLFSYVNLVTLFRSLNSAVALKVEIEMTEFRSDDAKTTDAISKHFNNRSDAVYLWIDADFFSRLSLNYPTLHYLKIESSGDRTCHLILEKMYSGVFKVIMCSDYDLYNRAVKSNMKVFNTAGISGLMTIRNKHRSPNQQLLHEGLGSSRLTGFGSLVLIDYTDLSIADFEMEDIWLML